MISESQKARLLKELRQVRIVSIACKRSGFPRSTYYRIRKEDSVFNKACKEAIKEGTNLICDMAESALVSKIQKGDTRAAIYMLEHHRRPYKISKPRKTATEDSDREIFPGFAEAAKEASRILEEDRQERLRKGLPLD